ncbi:MAG: tRNA-dihydrouridine synthase [Planctomycetia bacterium]
MLTLGAIPISLPVVQAALSGYSDWPMRALAREMGAPYSIAEVVIDAFVNNLKERSRTRHHLLVTDDDHPVGAQLMGSDPDSFPAAAIKLVHAGFDVIDINFGCPAKKASGRCRGGYHLGQPETAIRILQLVRETVPPHIPVTVKMRRGIDDSQKSRDQFFQILSEAFQIGIAAATIHGRTVEQKYVGPSRWEFLKTVRAEFPNATLLGSGDLFTATDCVRMLKETGVNGVTAARGAIGNPWIFQQAAALLRGEHLPKAPDLHQQQDLMRRHLELAEFALPAEQFLRQVRKFCIFYSAWHPEHLKVRQAFASVTTLKEWSLVLSRWYSANQPGCFPENPGNLNAGSRGNVDDETNISGD